MIFDGRSVVQMAGEMWGGAVFFFFLKKKGTQNQLLKLVGPLAPRSCFEFNICLWPVHIPSVDPRPLSKTASMIHGFI